MRKKKTFNLSDSGDEFVDHTLNAMERDYAERWEPNPMLRNIIKYGIMSMILLGCTFVWYNKKFAPVETTYSESETKKQRFLGSRYAAFSKLVKAGDAAFEAEEYFEAAYNYKQSLSYYPSDLPVYEKLLTATEKSCEEGNDLHCKNIKGIQNRMEEVKRLMEEK